MTTHACSYCGLPTPTPRPSAPRREPGDTTYCCLGCRIAAGIAPGQDDSEPLLARLGLAIFFTMNVMVFTLVLWTWNVHEIAHDTRTAAFRDILRYACLLFTSPVLILLGGPLLESSLAAFRARQFTTDLLLLLGVAAAFGYSVVALMANQPDVYFEVCCMILVAVTLGKWLEGTAKRRATKTIQSLRQLLPENVRVLHTAGEAFVPLSQVSAHDRLRVLPGERIPTDGTVAVDLTIVDEQLVTGESLPVTKHRGDPLFAGSMNLSHELVMLATRSPAEGAISRLIKAVEDATSARACRSVRMADRLAAWFVPCVGIMAALAFALHLRDGVEAALMTSLATILISCPCALGIATPLALWAAINAAARRGVVFRNGDAVVQLATMRSLGIDKTGTLTKGDVRVTKQRFATDEDEHAISQVALGLARSSSHPLAKAIHSHLIESANSSSHTASRLTHLQDHPGRGITATMAPHTAMLGSLEFAKELDLHLPATLALETDASDSTASASGARAIVAVGWNHEVKGIFYLADTVRPESELVLEQIQKLGVQVTILTGDTQDRAEEIARLTGVRAIGKLLPEDKAKVLQTLPSPVGMVGDGLNDALSLTTADLGIALDCGADVTRDSAGICLMGSTLRELPAAIELARATREAMRINLAWAVGYNAIGVGFALTGNLNPIVAAIAMVGSSLFVLTNSIALGVKYDVHTAPSQESTSEHESPAFHATSNPTFAPSSANLETVG